ncbi:GIY-YIG nuclease family protein [Lactovum miscens]|uniref:Putative endonuclease n=1 Tax=Lactovum miscens TaxID=190387 RepID=A0A841C7I4_9LACT|nr:GIY-YIG nuclease family protein [Lactovum miscens]MBB5888267.1 putative endonuclease [Lactovum miscens]
MKKTYFTYVLLCSDNTYYCGFTDNLEKRVDTHNAGMGGKYTSLRIPVNLIAHVEFDNEHDARSCEWWFKHKLQRSQKTKLIESNHIEEYYMLWKEKRGK